MRRPTAYILSLGLLSGALACKDKPSEPTVEAPPVELNNQYEAASKRADAISSMFPEQLAGYTHKTHKTKTKDWGVAHSATYINGKDELKVVVNDAPPLGRAEWAAFFQAGETYKGFPIALDKTPEKQTLMVRVEKRFRVDFKSRTMPEDLLRKAAAEFDFNTVQALLQVK